MVFMERNASKIEGRMHLSRIFADTPEELDRIASACDLSPEWKMFPGTKQEHYTISWTRRKIALKHGVVVMDADEITARLRGDRKKQKKNTVANGPWEAVMRTTEEITEVAKRLGEGAAQNGYRQALAEWISAVKGSLRALQAAQDTQDKARLDELDRPKK